MHLRNLRIAAGVALSVGLLAVGAHAQQPASSSDDAQGVRAHLDKADRAYSEGRYSDAAASFLAADRLQPTPALQLALGKTYEQMNDPSHALASYREYFVRAPRAADRAQVQARVTVLAAQLAEKGVQQISVSSVPAGATVVIDAKPLGTTPIYVDLSPGAHHVEFHRQGFESAGLDFELSALQPLNVMTTLVPSHPGAGAAKPATAKAPQPTPPVVATPPAPETIAAPAAHEETAVEAPVTSGTATDPSSPLHEEHAQQRDDVTTYMRTFGFAAVGGSVVALGTAVAFELMRSHSESRARQQRQQIAFKDTLDTMHTQQTVARVFAISAGVLAAAGGVLLVMAAEREKADASAEGAAVACAPTGCTASYRGHF
jgi:hypothetical protein